LAAPVNPPVGGFALPGPVLGAPVVVLAGRAAAPTLGAPAGTLAVGCPALAPGPALGAPTTFPTPPSMIGALLSFIKFFVDFSLGAFEMSARTAVLPGSAFTWGGSTAGGAGGGGGGIVASVYG